ncbi:ATP-dependent RNA helicase ddx1 [Cichlidogyrus casuarinus]|uniref:ATP-dependent RNA helicase ddx1 n=1 Tax=Cichlidogyrus casuarinus TaxID=1844966 RepID=A0ABD2QHU8_9PLAT
MTLPDEKQNYVHRIGRVGRAERMGLAISFVASVKEKVWYHSNCNTRGRGCYDTRLTTDGGCCVWYNELQYLADIEEHLGVTIDQVENELSIKPDSIDGKVVYGQKLQTAGAKYESHAAQLAHSVKELHKLEKKSQLSYLALRHHGLWSS